MSDKKNSQKTSVKEMLAAILSDYFDIGDSYHFILNRVKLADLEADDFEEYSDNTVEEIVEHLTTSGVVFQKMIPVNERLPTIKDADSHENIMVYEIRTKSWKSEHLSFINMRPHWYSHWMPLPEPPKEDT